ncbi:MAG: glycoside hydrolase family 32 protein [Saprospiraceae bacterium]|nr:glycoside hydrolase family 32 protein [Saprospiraceae bacterium]
MKSEPHRPNFHFTPPGKWMNDPNGMVYYEGEYHLFYQHYPDSTVWGPMHWGHAVSKDMVNWEHLPIALYPDSLGYIFSGSAVIDWNNSSGFGKEGRPPMVAMFTYHNMEGEQAGREDYQYQGIAYSNDKGRTWTKYSGNPVIPNPGIKDFRDTKVIWDATREQWLMVLAAWDKVIFYASTDIKNWTKLSDFGQHYGAHGGVWECPDFFPMTVKGTDTQKWVLLLSLNPGGPNGGSATQYFVGDFDGKTFTLDPAFAEDVAVPEGEQGNPSQGIWLDYGRDNYAGVTWSDAPDNRRLFMGWMSNWNYAQVVPTASWRSAMTLPRELSLVGTESGYRLLTPPVKELESLRSTRVEIPAAGSIPFYETGTELVLEFALSAENGTAVIELRNTLGEVYQIGFNLESNQFFSDRTHAGKSDFSELFASNIHYAPRASSNPKLKMHLYFDVASAELFADGGSTNITDIFFPNADFSEAKLILEGGVKLVKGEAFSLFGG